MYIAHGGKKYVYCVFTGGDGKTFGRLDIEQGDLSREWEFLSPLPKPASDGCAIAYDGMYIYVARGCGSREIYRFEMPTVQNPIGKWYKMADVSSAVAKGAGMVNVGGTLYNVDGTVRAGGGSLYLLTGGGTTIFVKFAPSGNRDNLITEGQWSSVGTDLTAGFAESGSLVYPGGNFIYASRSTGGTGLFYKYNITANNWNGSAVIAPLPFYDSTPEQIASTSIQVKMDDYSMFSYPGRGKYIYLRAGQGDNNRTKFLRMDVSNDSWELLNDLPDEIGSLYATTYFADVTTLPSLRAKGDAIADSYTGELSFFSGANYSRAWKFRSESTAAASKWIDLTYMPSMYIHYGYAMCYPGYDASHPNAEKYLYYINSNESSYSVPAFRYDIKNNRWEKIKPYPKPTYYAGRRMCYVDGYIYMLNGIPVPDYDNGGNYSYFLYRYPVGATPRDGQWELVKAYSFGTTTKPTGDYQYGPSIAGVKSADGHTYIYMARCNASYFPGLYKLDACPEHVAASNFNLTANNNRPSLSRMYGTNITLPPGSDYMYITTAASSNVFEYCISTDTWRQLAANSYFSPYDTASGGMVYMKDPGYPGTGNHYLYAFYGISDNGEGRYSRWARFIIPAPGPDGGQGTWELLEAYDDKNFMPVTAAILPSSDPDRVGYDHAGIYIMSYSNSRLMKYDPQGTDIYTGTQGSWTETLWDRDFSKTDGETNDGNVITDSNGNIYIFCGDVTYSSRPTSHVWIYSTRENRWTGLLHAPFKIFGGTRAVYIPGLDTIYACKGHTSNLMYKYMLSGPNAGTWSYNVTTGRRFERGAQMALGPVAGGSRTVYVLHGYESDAAARFTKFIVPLDGSTESWSTPGTNEQPSFTPNWNQSTMTTDRNNVAWLLEQNTTNIYKYVPGQGWNKMGEFSLTVDEVDMVMGSGALLFAHSYHDGTSWHDYLYAIPYGTTTTMVRIPIDGSTGDLQWDRVSSVPYIINTSMNAAVGVTGKPWFYFFSTANANSFSRFYPGRPDLSANDIGTWDEPTYLPVSPNYRSSSCGYKGYIYFLQQNTFYRYNIKDDVWEDLPQPTGNGIGNWEGRMLAVDCSSGSYIFVTGGYGQNTLFRYSIADGIWRTFYTPNSEQWYYGSGLAVVGDHLYALQGGGPSTNGNVAAIWSWDLNVNNGFDEVTEVPSTLRALPSAVSRGGGMVAANNCLWVAKGGRTQVFWKYEFQYPARGWQNSNPLPAALEDSQPVMVYPGFGNYIFLQQGSSFYDSETIYGSNIFMRFNLTNEQWEEVVTSPDILAATYPDVATLKAALCTRADTDTDLINAINAAAGATPQEVITNLLASLSPEDAVIIGIASRDGSVPYPVMACSTLAYAGGNYFYMMPGRSTIRIGRFMPFSVGEFIAKPKEVGVHTGWGVMSWQGLTLNGIKVSARTGSKSDMSDSVAWGSTPDIANGADLKFYLGGAIKPTDKFFQYKVSFFTSDVQLKPVLQGLTFNYKKYPAVQELTSPVFDTQKIKARIHDLSWVEMKSLTETPAEKTGKAVRVQLKAAGSIADINNPATAWWLGDSGAMTFYNDFLVGSEGDYSMDRDIALKAGYAELASSIVYDQAIIINNTNDALGGTSETVTDYQIKVEIGPGNTNFWKVVREDGSDIRFADKDAMDKFKKLPYWIETFDFTGQNAVIWVKIPQIDQNTVKTIYLYYGVKSAAPESNFKNTMVTSYAELNDAGLVGAWSFDDVLQQGSNKYVVNDVSGNGNALITGSKWRLEDGKTGGKAFYCNRGGYLTVSNSAAWNSTTGTSKYELTTTKQLTIEMRVKFMTPSTGWSLILRRGYHMAGGWGMIQYTKYIQPYWPTYDGWGAWWGSYYFKEGQWTDISYTMDISNPSYNTVEKYINGNRVGMEHPNVSGTYVPANMSVSNSNMYFGDSSNIMIDEIRIYDRVLSGDEIRAHYEQRKFTPHDPIVTVDSASPEAPVFADWDYFQPVIIDNNSSPAVDKSNQTVVVTIGDTPETQNFWSTVTSANEIRISDGYPVPYKYRVMSFDRTTVGDRKAVLYIKVPFLSAAKPLTAYLYFGNSAAVDEQSPLSEFIPTEGLEGCWEFNKPGASQTQAPDSSGNNYTGTISPTLASWTTLGKIGSAIEFSGGSVSLRDMVTLGMNGSFTVSAWIKPTDLSATPNVKNPIMSIDGNGLYLGVINYNYSNKLYADYNSVSVTGLGSISDTEDLWYHVVYRYDTSASPSPRMEMFINGVADTNGNLGTVFSNSTDVVKLGKRATDNFGGLIDEVYVYSRLLSDEEITSLSEIPDVASVNFLTSQANTAAAFSPYKPVIQPVMGVFYDTRQDTQGKIPLKITSFNGTGSGTTGGRTGVKYQFSNDGWHWYWYDTNVYIPNTTTINPNFQKWQEVTLGYDEANYSSDMTQSVLSSFQTGDRAYGDFFYRAYLYSEDGTMTPRLDRVTIQVQSQVDSYYMNPAGNTINAAHREIQDNKYFQYKMTFYSDGENMAIVDKIVIKYVEPKITIVYPNAAGLEFEDRQAYNIRFKTVGLKTNVVDDGTVKLQYTVNGTDYVTMPGGDRVPITAADNVEQSFSFTMPDNVHTDKFRVKVISNAYNEGPQGMYTTAAYDSWIYNFRVTWPSAEGGVFEEGNATAYMITYSVYGSVGTVNLPVKLWLVRGTTEIPIDSTYQNYYPWTIPEDESLLGDGWRIKIVDSNPVTPKIDYSDHTFTIAPKATISLIEPLGYSNFPPAPTITEVSVGDTLDFLWDTTGIVPASEERPVAFKYYRSEINDSWELPPYADDTLMTDDDTKWVTVQENVEGWNKEWIVPDDLAGEPKGIIEYTPEGFGPRSVVVKIGESGVRAAYGAPVYDVAWLKVNPPSLAITAPVYATGSPMSVWVVGDKLRTITWTKDGALKYPLKVQYSKDYWDDPAVATWTNVNTTPINKPVGSDALSYTWTNNGNGIPEAAANGEEHPVYLRVVDSHPYDLVASPPVPVMIYPEHKIELITPAGDLLNGEEVDVFWKWYGEARGDDGLPVVGTLTFELSFETNPDGSPIWPPAVRNVANTRYTMVPNVINVGGVDKFCTSLTVPQVESDHCRVRIFGPNNPSTGTPLYSESGEFKIKIPNLTITGPNVGPDKKLLKNGKYNITWSVIGYIGDMLTLQYRVQQDGGVWPATWTTVSDTVSNAEGAPKTFEWRVPLTANGQNIGGRNMQMRLQSNYWKKPPAEAGESRVQTPPFEVTVVEPGVTVTAPSAAASGANGWVIGNEYDVKWTIDPGVITADAVESFKVYYSTISTAAWLGGYLPITPINEVLINDPVKVDPATGITTIKWHLEDMSASANSVVGVEIYYKGGTVSTVPYKSAPFTIAPPSITVKSMPDAQYRIGQVMRIKWYPTGAMTYPIKLLYNYPGVNDTWDAGNMTNPNAPGLIAAYNSPAALVWETEPNGDQVCVTEWPVPDNTSLETPYVVKIKAHESSAGAARIESNNIVVSALPPLIVPDLPALHSITEKINVTWSVTGGLRGPVQVKWARANGSIVGDIGEIPVAQVNSIHNVADWPIPVEAAGPDVVIFIDDVGWRKPGQLQSKIINQTNPFTILPEPLFSMTLPTVMNNTWRIGETYNMSWAKVATNNVYGAASNSYKVDMWSGDDATGQSVKTVTSDTSGDWFVSWYIDPDEVNRPYTDLRVRVQDNSIWNPMAALGDQEHATFFSDSVNRVSIAIPSISLIYPKTEGYWALNDKPTIEWQTEGHSTPYGVTVQIVLDPNGTPDIRHISIDSNTDPATKRGSIQWLVDRAGGTAIIIPAIGSGYLEAKIVVFDATEYNDGSGGTLKVVDESQVFKIIRSSALLNVGIAKAQPIPDDPTPKVFVLGTSANITWEKHGQAIRKVRIVYAKPEAPDTEYLIADGVPNTGSYTWYIDANSECGANLIVRVIAYGDESKIDDGDPNNDVLRRDIQSQFQGFRLRGNIRVLAPAENARLLAKFVPSPSIPNIIWETVGKISRVQIEVSVNDGPWETVATDYVNTPNPANGESGYPWTVPDVPEVLTNPNTGVFLKPVAPTVKVRVKDMTDLDGTIGESKTFYIDYCKVTWSIFDIDTYAKQANFTVKEYLAGQSTAVSTEGGLGPEFFRYYPYGMRTTEFDNAEYLTSSKTWTPESAEDMNKPIYLQNRALANVEWHVILAPVYTAQYVDGAFVDKLTVTAWLEKKGKIVGMIADERLEFHGCRIEIYDNDAAAPLHTIEDATIDDKGTFYIDLPNPGFQSGHNYFCKAYIQYGMLISGKDGAPDAYPTYVSGAGIDVTIQRDQLEQAQGLSEQVATVQNTVVTESQTIKDKLDDTKQEIATNIEAAKAEIKADTADILTATETTLPAQIEEATTAMTNTMRSEILNRDNVVRNGQALTIRYRTPGSSPVIDVYDAKNVQRVVKGVMLPAAGAAVTEAGGVYEYEVKFTSGWGRGDFTIVCSDSGGNMDAMIISVLKTDIEDVSSQIAAVLGSTSNLGDLKEVADMMNSQFSMIETALSKVGRDLVYEVKGANTNASAAMDTVYKQLVTLASQIKQSSGEANLNLGKLYDVAAEKKSDMTYLKNKTQQLKAAMEMNTKMIDNLTNKPITQTWYEYK
jgi:hypothetical protein